MRIAIVFMSIFLLGGCSMFGYNSGTKEPPYKRLMQDGDYELREYSSIVMVTAFSNGSFSESQGQSFRKLFDYISGKNISQKSIPMTAPVLMEPITEKISMTAPVLMENKGEGWTMSFVLPETYTLQTAPQPADDSLSLEERKNIKYAVLRFNGLFKESSFSEKSKDLQGWMLKNNLKPSGPALRAGYNPPWTIPPLRRNEILIPTE